MVGGEKDSVDNLSVTAATATPATPTAATASRKKKTYSWEIEENKSPRYLIKNFNKI